MDDHIKLGVNTSLGGLVYGMTLDNWVAIFTCVYLVAQFIVLIPKMIERWVALRDWWKTRKAARGK